MSNIWNDVRADPASTEALARELVATAGAVGEVVGILVADGPVVAEDWGGPHRETFDEERARLVAVGDDVIGLLLAGARAVTAAQAAADGEQQLRVRLRNQALAEQACVVGRPC